MTIDIRNLTPTGKRFVTALHSQPNKTVFTWTGPVRSGKTVSIVIGMVELALRYHAYGWGNDKYAIVAPTLPQVQTNTRDTFEQVCEAYGLTFREGQDDGRKAYIVGEFARFHLYGGETSNREGRLRGASYTAIWIDEATKVHESFIEMARTRRDFDVSKLILSMNADSPYHPIKVAYIDTPKPNVANFFSTIQENPYFSEVMRQELLSGDPSSHYYKRFVLNEWAPSAGLVFPIGPEHIKSLDDYRHGVVGFDPGASGTTAAVLYTPLEDGKWVISQEYRHNREQNGHVPDQYHIDRILDDLHWRPKAFILDPITGYSIAPLIERRGMPAIIADMKVEPGIMAFNNALAAGLLYVDDRCRGFLSACAAYSYDARNDKPDKGSDSHYPDAARYAARHLFPNYASFIIERDPNAGGF